MADKSISQLEKELALLKKQEAKESRVKQLKSEIFRLKYRKPIAAGKAIKESSIALGKSAANVGRSISYSFGGGIPSKKQKQFKKKKKKGSNYYDDSMGFGGDLWY